MACEELTIDSNVTGARIAEEACPGILPGSSVDFPGTPTWELMEPNSYDDFGSEVTTVAREPLNPSRQRKKGTVVDLDASGGFQQDFTETGLLKVLQGFLFADAHIPGDTRPLHGTSIALLAAVAADNEYTAAAGLGMFAAGDLILASGFSQPASNGIKTVVAATATAVEVAEAVGNEAVAPVSARLQKVGVRVPASELAVVLSGGQAELTSVTFDFTDLGLVEGSWIFLGTAGARFVSDANTCFARVDVIETNRLILGKTSKQMVAVAAGPAVDILLPTFIRNEPNPLDIKRRSYQIERTLGRDNNGTMSEYLVGAVANEFTLNVEQAALLTADMSFVAMDNEQRDGATGVKPGNRPSLLAEDAYNSTSDIRRFKMSLVTPNSFQTPLFGYATEMTIEINNNVSANKALGVLGAMSMTAGMFEVGGSATVYFSNIAAVQAVRNNADVTMDLILVKNGGGWVFDVPLLALGDGRLNVEANSPITLPLETNAAESDLGHTLMVARFPFLPDFA